MLRNIVCQGARHGILQEPLIRDQTVAVDRFHLRRVKVHGHDANQNEYAKNRVQNRDARGCEEFERQRAVSFRLEVRTKFNLPGSVGSPV